MIGLRAAVSRTGVPTRERDEVATPDLGDVDRPDLKSVGGDLLEELEAISEQQQRRQDRVAELEAELEDREQTISDLRDELELSVHHTIGENPLRSDEEYEIHAGTADVLRIPKSLVETAYTVTGVDIRNERVRCGAEIQVVEDG